MRYHPGFVSFSLLLISLGSGLGAEDKIFLEGAAQPTLGIVEKVDDTGVTLKFSDGSGSTTIQRANIERVEITPPEEAFKAAQKAWDGGKMAEVASILAPIYTRYRGLPQNWIETISVRLGQAYVAEKDWIKAGALFDSFVKFHPNSESLDVIRSGQAQALYGQNKLAEAAVILEQLVADREKDVLLSEEQSRALGRACVILGRCHAGAKKNQEALEAFLKTVVLYYHDSGAVAEALYESALMYERLNNPARARGQLEELLSGFPNMPVAAEAKKKLDSMKPLP